MIFETHAHYDDEQFDSDRDEILSGMYAHGIEYIVNVGASIETTKNSIALADRYEFIYAAVGVHPSDIADLNEESFAWLREQTKHQGIVAIGEIGLDYYWEKDEAVREQQKYWFRRQLELAQKEELPVIIHSRDAAADTLDIIKEMHNSKIEIPGVIHCFSYSKEMAAEYVKMGYYIGVGGVVTFKNAKALKQVVEQTDISRIVLETDCPYLAPEPNRGKRNSSYNLPYVAAEIARLKGMDEDEVIRITNENARRLYKIQ